MKNVKDFQTRYERWKKGERYWDIRGVDLPRYDQAEKQTTYSIDPDGYYLVKKDGANYRVNPNVATSDEITVTTPEIEVVAQRPKWMIDTSQFARHDYLHEGGTSPTSADKFVDENLYNSNPFMSGLARAVEDWRADRSPIRAVMRNFGWWNPVISSMSAALDHRLGTESNVPQLMIPQMIQDYGNKYSAALHSLYHLTSDEGLKKTKRYYDELYQSNPLEGDYSGKFWNTVASGVGDLFDAALLKNGVSAIVEPVKKEAKLAVGEIAKEVKRSKVAKQLTAPARAKRAKETMRKLSEDRNAKYYKYRKFADKAYELSTTKLGRKINLDKNNRHIGLHGKIIRPNWDKITKEEDVKGIMKRTRVNPDYIDNVKMGPAIAEDGNIKAKVPYVEIASRSGYNPNVFINAGDYEMPIFQTGDIVKGFSKADGASATTTTRITPPGFRNHVTFTAASDGDIVRTGFDELRGALRKNIDYLKKEVPGFKPFGSAEGVSENALSHNTHDIDGYISREAFDKFKKTHSVSERPNTNGNTYIYSVRSGKYGEAGDIDLNIIDVAKNGVINNSRTAELYRQFFPLEYQKQVQAAVTRPGKNPLRALDANGKPMTAQALIDSYDPLVKTIMDAMEINYSAGAKAKHAGRILEYLAGDRPDAVSNALQQTAKMAGEKGHLLPKMQFGSVDDNIALLEKIGFKGDLRSIASSPEKMQNALDYWYLSGRSNIRQVNVGDAHQNGGTVQTLFRNLSDWNASGVASGGYASGAGLNTIQDGALALGDRNVHGVIQPYINGLEKMTDPNQVVDAVNYANGIRFTQDQANRIFGFLELPFNRDRIDVVTGQDVLSRIPDSGDQVKTMLQNMSDEFGINALRGVSYNNSYSGITRRLGPQDAIGTNAGDVFLGGVGRYPGLPGWSPRMETVSKIGKPTIPCTEAIFSPQYQVLQEGFYRHPDLQMYFHKKYSDLADQLQHIPPSYRKAEKMIYPILDRATKVKNITGALGAGTITIGGAFGVGSWMDSRRVSREDAAEWAKEITDYLYTIDYPVLVQKGRKKFEKELTRKIRKLNYKEAYALSDEMFNIK